jgi:hypothetical protein
MENLEWGKNNRENIFEESGMEFYFYAKINYQQRDI